MQVNERVIAILAKGPKNGFLASRKALLSKNILKNLLLLISLRNCAFFEFSCTFFQNFDRCYY
jgi:hypothetical protein